MNMALEAILDKMPIIEIKLTHTVCSDSAPRTTRHNCWNRAWKTAIC